MPSIIKKLVTSIAAVMCAISFASYTNAADLNMPGFTGQSTSTIILKMGAY